MKKVLSVLLAALMLVALFAACSGGATATTAAPKTIAPLTGGGAVATATKVEGSKKLLSIIIPKAVGSNWFKRTEMGGQTWAQDTGNLSMMVGSTKADAAVQIQSIQDALALKPDIISIVPNSPEACEPIMKQAMESGVIVTTQEASNAQNIDVDVEAFDNAAYGAHFFEAAMKKLGADKDSTGKYVYFVGFLTSPTHNQWAQGAIDYQKANFPKWEIVTGKQVEGEENQQVAYAKTKEFLQKDPSIKCFFGSSGGDPPGIALAIEELGLSGKVIVMGTCMPSLAGPGLKSGAITMGSFWDPFETQYVCNEIAVDLINKVQPKTGNDYKRPGYNNVTVKGKVVYGNAWIDFDNSNIDKYNFI